MLPHHFLLMVPALGRGSGAMQAALTCSAPRNLREEP